MAEGIRYHARVGCRLPSWSLQVSARKRLGPLNDMLADVVDVGHSGEIFATRFDPTGQFIASGSMDRSISTLRAKPCRNDWRLTRLGHSAMEDLRTV